MQVLCQYGNFFKKSRKKQRNGFKHHFIYSSAPTVQFRFFFCWVVSPVSRFSFCVRFFSQMRLSHAENETVSFARHFVSLKYFRQISYFFDFSGFFRCFIKLFNFTQSWYAFCMYLQMSALIITMPTTVLFRSAL